ncbi:carbohydrate ABC transporter permease [Alicyclobacillus fodiniaquatilis]|uniref:Carbohydrate ABC transporter permease n=1 Tax=Alicyclobacillus fodiniaquatilis TaxID=1661150 RepID=A0ABW4JN75_9BACL
MARTAVKDTTGDRIFMAAIYVLLVICLVVVLYPLVYIVSASFSSAQAVNSGQVWLYPVHFTLDGYRVALSNIQIVVGFLNSLFYAFFGTLVGVSLTILMAFPLSRKTFVGRNILTSMLLFTMIFSGGLIPTYLIVKGVGLLDTRWAMVFPAAMNVFLIIVARSFFQSTIPDELAEAAEMDGCSDFGFLLRVVLPLSKPIIAVLVLIFAVGQWNSYFNALIYLSSDNLFPLQLVLRNILILNTQSSGMENVEEMLKRQNLADLMKYSLMVIGSIPVLAMYPFIQKHFVKGMFIGSVKG